MDELQAKVCISVTFPVILWCILNRGQPPKPIKLVCYYAQMNVMFSSRAFMYNVNWLYFHFFCPQQFVNKIYYGSHLVSGSVH